MEVEIIRWLNLLGSAVVVGFLIVILKGIKVMFKRQSNIEKNIEQIERGVKVLFKRQSDVEKKIEQIERCQNLK